MEASKSARCVYEVSRLHATLPRSLRLLLAIAWAVAALALPAQALAQGEPEFFEKPFAPEQWELGRRFDESQLRYCVDKRDGDWEVSAAIAEAIAGALLLEPVPYVVESELVLEDITRVYALLLEHCNIHMGFKLIPEGYGTWAMVTRPYYETDYVFVTDDPAIQSLADLEPGGTIAATIGTSAHVRLVSYLTAMPADQRWAAFPMGTNDVAIDAVLNGRADVGPVWAPVLWGKQQQPEFASLRVIDPAPLPPTTLGVGALLLSNETFLRSAIDEAIAALRADGTISGIIDSFEFPASAAP